mmetsp:Transcript_64902/g.104239  ORF Transcript_64902/g.104239 Transcript_64902/m.104239 type:complete len:88 (+) Transcript_64902:425-688(+)
MTGCERDLQRMPKERDWEGDATQAVAQGRLQVLGSPMRPVRLSLGLQYRRGHRKLALAAALLISPSQCACWPRSWLRAVIMAVFNST